MKKIWNGFIYGDLHTRLCIGGVVLFSLLSVILIVISCLTGKFSIFTIGLLFCFAAIILSQTFQLVDDSFVAQVNEKGKKETVHVYVASKKAKVPHNDQEETTGPANGSRIGSEELIGKDKENRPAQFDHYNQQYMKKIYRKYHVKKDHRTIIIDSSKTYHIKECPAFIWRVHNKVFLLLLEKEPRKISISRDMIRHMEYEPKVRGDKSKEYLAFQKENLVTSVFGGLLPDYFDSKAQNRNLKYKNLYKIYPDILLSNRSAATVLDLLCLNFMPEDRVTQSDKLNGYFKRAYAAHIMYLDKVYSITEYKENIEMILKEMCYADMPEREFQVTLENLVKGRMISFEYAEFYSEMRKKRARSK